VSDRAGRKGRSTCFTQPGAIIVCALAIVMGSLYVTIYSFAVADPMPRHIDASFAELMAVLFAAVVAASLRLKKPATLHKRTMWGEGTEHQPWPHERQFFAAVAAPARP
jgi:hypothetical protein